MDVGSKADIYALLAGALERGLAVLLVSTDFEEIAGVAHRALVFDRGAVVRELAGTDLTLEQLNLWAAGGAGMSTQNVVPAQNVVSAQQGGPDAVAQE